MWRKSLTAVISISLNVVSNAAVCCALTSRAAMRRRMRLIGTTSSSSPSTGVSAAAIGGLTGDGGGAVLTSLDPFCDSTWRSTSVGRRLPSSASTSAACRPNSRRVRRAAGVTAISVSCLSDVTAPESFFDAVAAGGSAGTSSTAGSGCTLAVSAGSAFFVFALSPFSR